MSAHNHAKRLLTSSNPMEQIETTSFSLDDMLKSLNNGEQAKLLAIYSFHAHQQKEPLQSFRHAMRAFSQDPQTNYLKNAVIAARDSKDANAIEESLACAIKHAAQCKHLSEKASLFDVICHSYGDMKDLKKAALFGTKALQAKHEHVTQKSANQPLAPLPKVPFDFFKPKRNVISFSLFGDQQRYIQFALENAKATPFLYPGWTCRFYIDDTVPPQALQQLLAHKAQVILRPRHNPKTNSGLFWRFEVASDPNVDYFLVRDADSLISVKEKLAVDDWLLSDKSFHIMRDYYSHSELILAGMWGGTGNKIPKMAAQIDAWHKRPKQRLLGQANQDQLFLREIIWPAIHKDVCTHDSVFSFGDPKPFSPLGLTHPNRHIGQNMGIFLKG